MLLCIAPKTKLKLKFMSATIKCILEILNRQNSTKI